MQRSAWSGLSALVWAAGVLAGCGAVPGNDGTKDASGAGRPTDAAPAARDMGSIVPDAGTPVVDMRAADVLLAPDVRPPDVQAPDLRAPDSGPVPDSAAADVAVPIVPDAAAPDVAPDLSPDVTPDLPSPDLPPDAPLCEGNSCDDGNPCTIDMCTPQGCTNVAVAAGTVCRAASGACDVAEICQGAVCPADGVARGTSCRPSRGSCDFIEFCDGVNKDCPADAVAGANVTCRRAEGVCDEPELCNGKDRDCPADAKKSPQTVCRPVIDGQLCDVAESCTGSSNDCPADGVKTEGTVCNPAQGACDIAEVCDGATKTCPADRVRGNEFKCGTADPAKLCDADDYCSGEGKACNDAVKTQGTVCRTEAGPCDVAEVCTGGSAECPADAFLPTDRLCRPALTTCDVAETCAGSSAQCPGDGGRPSSPLAAVALPVCGPAVTCEAGKAECNTNDGVTCESTLDNASNGPCGRCDLTCTNLARLTELPLNACDGHSCGFQQCPFQGTVPAGYYGSGTGACYGCPLGTYSDTPGATSAAACKPCEAGSHAGVYLGASACTPCPAGKYQPQSGQVQCLECPANTFSGAGAAACTPCPPGTWSQGNAAVCTPLVFVTPLNQPLAR